MLHLTVAFTKPFKKPYLSLSLCVTTLHIILVIALCLIFVLKGAWISVLVFRCNDPTYYTSYITLYGNNIARLAVVHLHCLAYPHSNLASSKGYGT